MGAFGVSTDSLAFQTFPLPYYTRHRDLSMAAMYIIWARLIRNSVPILGSIINNSIWGFEETMAVSVAIAVFQMGKGKAFSIKKD